jgi:GR25 family glycosyltransferase involved in LPS biosynthesis
MYIIKEKERMIDYNIYYINCNVHKKRNQQFIKNADKADIKVTRQVCVNGKNFTNKKILNFVKQKIINPTADITPIESAINMSFLKIWKKIANGKKEFSIILEDDSRVKSNFTDIIDDILECVNGLHFDVLYLYNGNFGKTKSKLKRVCTTQEYKLKILKETTGHNAGAAGYIITKDFAKYMHDKLKNFKMPHDMYMGYNTLKKVHLTLEMKLDKKKQCYESPVLFQECYGEYGTGASTQNYETKTIKEIVKDAKKIRLKNGSI